ncbi:MAG: septum formation protein Maf [Candidatus Rokubacteria bacterium]|nr:septum formation protein Maf [Candidatus Rokubacteria bacterium]MBI4256055.1 septum formation protein Maf [Candidatus Rokubacteria bacterium]
MAALILASASPRRRELLGRICPAFTVVPADVDESLDPGPVAAAVERLALRKARAVAAGARDAVVLAADTVVVADGVVLGKPAGPDEARAMLRRLRGRVHEVVTGVAVVDAAGREASLSVTTRVLMAAYSDATLHAYAASGAPLDKAGAYAIQDRDGALVDGLAGSYTNVVGLPLEATRRLLEGFGVRVSAAAGP